MKTRTFLLSSLACLFAAATAPAADCRINLALASNGAVASQRDNPFGLPAALGNDGLIVATANFAHTGNADNEWWEVNLGAPRQIAEVRFWVRSDGFISTRDDNLRLVIYDNASHTTEVYTEAFNAGSLPMPLRNVRFILPSVVTGQVVRIEHPVGVADYVQVNEVQVFGATVEEVDLAPLGTASESSVYGTAEALYANDGLNPGDFSEYAHTGAGDLEPWWQVDLLSMQSISAIRVFNLENGVPTRFDNISMTVLDNLGGVVVSNYNAVHPPVVTLPGHDFPNNKRFLAWFFTPPISGQVVKVSRLGEYMGLSEVEVLRAYTTTPVINVSHGPTNRTVDLNSTVSLSVTACVAGANINYLSYQWQSNGVDIADATGPTYTTPMLTALGDYQYGVKLLLPGYSVTTQAVITVFSDVVPPTVLSNSFAARSTLKMTVHFSEALDPATATNQANYTFTGGPTVSNPVLSTNGADVTLEVAGLATCDDYTLTVSGVRDLAGNTIVTTNLSGTTPVYQINYARDGTATDTGNPWGFLASNAIDGDYTTFMHTLNSGGEYWEVDLGLPRTIAQINLWFRNDCCFDRDNNLQVTILDNPISRATVWTGLIGTAPTTTPRTTNLVVAPSVVGQIVRVEHIPGVAEYLDFTEVEVIPPSIGFCIVRSPASVSVVTNAPADFNVLPQGAGPFAYQWKHAGTNLPGATGQALHVPVAGPSQAGLYTVEVSNPYRTHTSDPALLTLVPAANVSTLLKINFDGSLSGTAYTLGPGEVDVTGTFSALAGTETISGGAVRLDSSMFGQGFSVTNNVVDRGNQPEASFIAEMLFTPTAGFDQGTGQDGGAADIFSFGSIYYTDANHSDAVFGLRYFSPTSYQLQMDAVLGGGGVTGPEIPVPGVANHVAMVYELGQGRTNNVLSYYLNANRVVALPFAGNAASASAGSVFAAFGQTVPGSTLVPRGLDGVLDGLVYATFTGVFNPGHNFQLYRPKLAVSYSSGQATFTWNVLGYALQRNQNVADPAGWSDVPNGVVSPVSLVPGSGNAFFRLRKQ